MMNFSEVKLFSIPEGEVINLSIGGVPVWAKAEEEETYTPIEYLQFNADKVFDTGIICNQNSTIEVKFTREASGAMYLYGVRTSSNTASYTAYLATSGAWRFGNTYKNFTISLNTICTMKVNKTGVYQNGTKNNYGTSVKNNTAPYTLTLGSARTTAGAQTAAQFKGKIYYFKMYDGDTLVLDWQPCKNKDGVEGFYDTITNKFIA